MSDSFLSIGKYIKWPYKTFRVNSGELVLVTELVTSEKTLLNRKAFFSFKQGDLIPALSVRNTEINLLLKAVTDCNLEEIDNSESETNKNEISRWRMLVRKLDIESLSAQDQKMLRQAIPSNEAGMKVFMHVINASIHYQLKTQEQQLKGFTAIDNIAERQLFLSFEDDPNRRASGSIPASNEYSECEFDPLIVGLEIISNCLNRPLTEPKIQAKNPKNLVTNM